MASTPFRVITVCTGNICRSPMAEYQLRDALRTADTQNGLEVVVDSAGISDEESGRGMDARAADQLRQQGIDPSGHTARQWRQEWFAERDLILAMDVNHHRALLRWAPDEAAQAKVRMFRSFDPTLSGAAPEEQGIYDPWYGARTDFLSCADMISAAMEGLVDFVQEQARAKAQG